MTAYHFGIDALVRWQRLRAVTPFLLGLLLVTQALAEPTSAKDPSRTEDPAAKEGGATSEGKAIAESLFERARQDLLNRDYVEACQKLAESHRIEPATGTLLNLAVCHELQGKIASAWAEYNQVMALAKKEGDAERRDIALERVRLLEPRLSYLTLGVGTHSQLPGLVVLLDRVSLGKAAWGSPLPIDPGAHVIEARAPEHNTWSTSIRVAGEARTYAVEVPKLEKLSTQRNVAPPPIMAKPPPNHLEANTSGGGRLVRHLGVGALGLAVLSAGLGTYFALNAANDWDERNAHCPDGRCDEQAVAAWNSARRNATFANAAFGLGILAAGAGTYLLLIPVDTKSGAGGQPKTALYLQTGGSF